MELGPSTDDYIFTDSNLWRLLDPANGSQGSQYLRQSLRGLFDAVGADGALPGVHLAKNVLFAAPVNSEFKRYRYGLNDVGGTDCSTVRRNVNICIPNEIEVNIMENLPYDYVTEDEPDFEIIGGERVFMAAAAPFVNHITIISRLVAIFVNYIDEHNLEAIVMPDADVYLSEKEHYRPDLSIICDLSMVKNGKRVHGVPDLVVEVLSESTMNKDIGSKKCAYEECGVKEYWIVDQWSKRIEVYHSIDGKFEFGGSYKVSEDEENPSNEKIKVSIFENLIVDVRDVFKWWIG